MEHPLKYTDQRQTLRTLSFGLKTFLCYSRTDCTCIDNSCKIRHIRFGFPGPNDAKQYALLPTFVGRELPFPEECVLLADKVYSNSYPIGTSFTEQQINRETPQVRRKYNIIISSNRGQPQNWKPMKQYIVIVPLFYWGGGHCCLCVCKMLKVY